MRYFRLGVVLWMLGLVPVAAQDRPTEEMLWQALREGRAVALIRHATAPGTGDPAGFRIGDCATQRNLSETGRAEARQLGILFRVNGIAAATMRSSAWCRCHDTAVLMELGPVVTEPALNSLFGARPEEAARTAELRQVIAGLPPGLPAVLVSHQTNIAALTGIYAASGGIVVVERGSLAVLGRLGT